MLGTRTEEFDVFVMAESDRLVRYGFWLTYDWGRAEDLLQLALLALWRHWRDVEPAKRTAYVKATMVRRDSSWRRLRRSNEKPQPTFPTQAGHDPYPSHDDALTLRAALSRLPARQRIVVVLRHLADMSEVEVADVLGCSVGTVKSQGSKGLNSLRRSLGLADAYHPRERA